MEDLLKQLVAFPTLSDDFAANHAALNFVSDYLEARGMYIQRFKRTPKMHEALVAATRPDNAATPTVLLAAHIDVIPASKSMFALRKQSGKYFGRGVYDMKCAIAGYMAVVDALQATLSEYDFAILITSDEELGNRDGVNATAEFVRSGFRPKMVILPDGGQDWQLETTANGYMHYTLEAHGRTGHSSRPWLGENATEKLVDAIHELRDHFRGQSHATDTLNVAAISTSPVPANQIPDFATVDFSIRLRHQGSLEHFRSVIAEICKKHDVKPTERTGFGMISNSLSNPYLRRYADITEQVTGTKVTGFHSYGGSDARFFAEVGIPYANAYPAGGGHHTSQEWLAEASLEQCLEIFLRYIQAVAHDSNRLTITAKPATLARIAKDSDEL